MEEDDQSTAKQGLFVLLLVFGTASALLGYTWSWFWNTNNIVKQCKYQLSRFITPIKWNNCYNHASGCLTNTFTQLYIEEPHKGNPLDDSGMLNVWRMYHHLHEPASNMAESFGKGQGGGRGHSDISVRYTLSDI